MLFWWRIRQRLVDGCDVLYVAHLMCFDFSFYFHASSLLIHFSHRLRISNRMYKRQHQLELRVEVEGVAEEGVEGEEDLCGGRFTRSLLKFNIIWLGVMIILL